MIRKRQLTAQGASPSAVVDYSLPDGENPFSALTSTELEQVSKAIVVRALRGTTRPPGARKLEKHRWLDQGLTAKGGTLRRLVEDVLTLVEQVEGKMKSRKRGRKADDEAMHRSRVEIVVCNLAYAVLNPPETGRITIDTAHGAKGLSRYSNPALAPKTLAALRDTLLFADVIDTRSAVHRLVKGSIAPGAWFAGKVGEYGVGLGDFCRSADEEVILLHHNAYADAYNPFALDEKRAKRRIRLDYKDTLGTRGMRDQLRSINAWLHQADIGFLPDGGKMVDPCQRVMRRNFVVEEAGEAPGFDKGGRLFGGFWQPLDKARRKGIRIEGEAVAILDYSSMFTRLAYARLGVAAPSGDLYDLPGFEGYRRGVKLAMNCFLYDKGLKRKGWPKGMGVGKGNDADALDPSSPAAAYAARLPHGSTVESTREAVLAKHPALKPLYGTAIGHRLMFMESEVLLTVLERLRNVEIIGLGLHDGLMVKQSQADKALDVMAKAALDVAGAAVPVSLRPL